MEDSYRKAFAEVLEVIEHSTNSIKEKIPKKIIDFFIENKDNTYLVKIDFFKSNWEDYIKDETQAILALIYRDYIVSKDKKQELLLEEKEEQIRIENELKEKYNTNNIFKNKHISNDEDLSDSIAMIVYKESFLKKLFRRIKNIFIK